MSGGIDRAGLAEAGRDEVIRRFLAAQGWDKAERRLLAGDASFRRYDRLTAADGRRAVLMDAPPPMENVRPFLAIDRLLASLDLSVPAIFAEDSENGLLLLEDLGDDTYTRLLAAGHDEADLYARATDLLSALHQRLPQAALGELRDFDADSAVLQVSRLLDWYWPAIHGGEPAAAIRAAFETAWRAVLPLWHKLPRSLVLFDYHVDNLLLLDRPGIRCCGLLDFQDALAGPIAFDLASLLEDVRRNVSPALRRRMIEHYLAANPAIDRDAFMTVYAVSAAQRNIRIAGTFARLLRRDNKPGYQRYMPRTWELIAEDLRHPAMGPVAAWFDTHLPAQDRRILA